MMDRFSMGRFVILSGALVLLAALTITAVSATEFYLLPDHSGVQEFCNNTTVELWLNATEPLANYEVNITYTCCCANITGYDENSTYFAGVGGGVCGFWTWMAFHRGGPPFYPIINVPVGLYHLGNLTIHCCNETPPCMTDLHFKTHLNFDEMGDGVANTADDGTFRCGTPQDFSKPLHEGWNLISLPLDPVDNSAGAVLSTVSYGPDAVYRYDAESKQFEPIEDTDVMNPGTGYFVHATAECPWTYSGYAYNSMNVSLQKGLNMVGWLNCSKDVDDALSSVSEDCYYAARWNTQAQRFEVYNPAAPPAFNDIATMDRGTGYFISAKQECALSESVS